MPADADRPTDRRPCRQATYCIAKSLTHYTMNGGINARQQKKQGGEWRTHMLSRKTPRNTHTDRIHLSQTIAPTRSRMQRNLGFTATQLICESEARRAEPSTD